MDPNANSQVLCLTLIPSDARSSTTSSFTFEVRECKVKWSDEEHQGGAQYEEQYFNVNTFAVPAPRLTFLRDTFGRDFVYEHLLRNDTDASQDRLLRMYIS